MNKVILIGRLGKDPELKQLSDNNAVCLASMATSEKHKDKSGQVVESTEWHNLTFWGSQAETIAKFCTKGSQLMVEGKIKTDSYEKDGKKVYSTKIMVHQFEFLGSKQSGSDQQAASQPSAPAPENTQVHEPQDDLPF